MDNNVGRISGSADRFFLRLVYGLDKVEFSYFLLEKIMEINGENEKIKEAFMKLETRQDVADLLGIREKSLRYFLYAIKQDNMYTKFAIKKKNGGYRNIYAPHNKLKSIQRKMAYILNCVYKIKPAAHGFVLDKNIITNAQNHVKRRYVFNIDLENFFEQIHFGRVRGMLMKPPYNIGSEAALVITQIACYNGKLPQGAPTSPILTNMICAPLDTQLTKLAKKYNLHYSRYADDLSFSSHKDELPSEIVYVDFGGIHIGKVLDDILTKNSFKVNANKIRMFDYHKRQEVTGLVVNQFVNIKREYIKKLRAILHHCSEDGIYEASKAYIEKNCHKSKYVEMIKNDSEENREKIIEWFKSVLRGKVGYIACVRGKNNKVFLKYAKELNEIFEEEVFRIDEEVQLLSKIEKSVFILEAQTNDNYIQGSGFIVKNIGLLTNYHVTESNEMYTVSTYKNEKVCSVSNEMNLIKNNRDIDYACYNFGKTSEDALDLGSSKTLTIGSEVFVVGYPDYNKDNSPEIQQTNIISERSFMGQRIYTIAGRIVHGASGGVVLNDEHKVVGVIRCGPVTLEETSNSAVQGIIPIDDIINDLAIQSK